MKKLLVCLCLLFVVILIECDNSSQAPSPYFTPDDPRSKQYTPKEQTPKEVTVYITRTGKKYHRITCRYLSKSCIPIELNSAKSRGYTPCSVCAPPIGLLPSQSDTKTAQKETDSNPFRKYRITQNDTKELLVLETVDCPECHGKKYATCSYCQGNDLTKQTCEYCNGQDLTKQICEYCNGRDLTRQTCDYCNGMDLTKQTCDYCNGSGKSSNGNICWKCNGTRHKNICWKCNGTGHKNICWKCNGTGHKNICWECNGTGYKNICWKCNGSSFKQCSTCLGEGLVLSLSNNVDKSKIPSIAENISYYGELNESGIPKTVYVRGYYKKDGTYVGSYYRAPPTSNYSSKNTPTYTPSVAENNSYYGEPSKTTGRPKTVHVDGYYRKDGTYVKGHYRSTPSRKK
ncbi:MAG: hypothetical protein V1709_05885 [Planctomycetota bacterium]